MGDNINGPSLIRTPNWLKKPLGRYYLYFSDHKGTYIRLAFSNSLMGPWEIYYNGVLELNDSYFMLQDFLMAVYTRILLHQMFTLMMRMVALSCISTVS